MNGVNKQIFTENKIGLMAQINSEKKKKFYSNFKIILLIISTNGLIYTWCDNSTPATKEEKNTIQKLHKDYHPIKLMAQSLISTTDYLDKPISIINESKQVLIYDAYLLAEIKEDKFNNNENHFYKIEIPKNETINSSTLFNQKIILVPHIDHPHLSNNSINKVNQYEINI